MEMEREMEIGVAAMVRPGSNQLNLNFNSSVNKPSIDILSLSLSQQ